MSDTPFKDEKWERTYQNWFKGSKKPSSDETRKIFMQHLGLTMDRVCKEIQGKVN